MTLPSLVYRLQQAFVVQLLPRPNSLIALCWLLAVSVSLGADQPRPNIVFLMADDQCTFSMGCYGTPGVQTPNLDQLARDGIVFDNHYDTTAICMASRANVMTGMFEYKTACNFSHGPLIKEHWLRCYPMLLRKVGYVTAFAGKFGFGVADEPNGKGRLPESDFDVWGGGPGQTFYETVKNKSIARYADRYPHSTLAYGAFGRDFIRDAARGQRPFCLPLVSKLRIDRSRPIHGSTMSTREKRLPSQATSVGDMASISQNRVGRDVNMSVSMVGVTVRTIMVSWPSTISRSTPSMSPLA